MTERQKLEALLTAFRELVQMNRQAAKYEEEERMKAWYEGRDAAFQMAADLLGKALR